MFDPVAFNQALSDGCTVQEATKRLKNTPIILGAAFYPLFSYTVNGVEYIRASYRLHEHFGRSAETAILWLKGKQCTVCYEPDNPGDAVVEDKSGRAEAKDIEPGARTKTTRKWLWIAAAIFAAFAVLQIVFRILYFLKR